MRNVACLIAFCLIAACGKSTEQEISEEAALARKHAEKGEPLAQLQLAQMLRTGDGVPKDLPQAVEWYRKAAKQGLPDAQYNLGVALDHGQGVAEDDTEAANWYRRAAEQGLTAAQYSLGRLLFKGEGVKRDFGAAARWFRIAAQAKHLDSIYHLGLMNRDGLGMPKDPLLAGKWLILSARLGKLEAQGDFHMLANELSPEQQKLAERLAKEEQALLSRPAPMPMGLLASHQGRLVHRGTGMPHTGRVVSNHPNGARKREVQLKEGLPDGWEITWFPDARLSGHTRFKDGLRNGIDEQWYRNGQLRLQVTNQTHRIMQATSFSADGNVTGQVRDGNGTLVIHYPNGARKREVELKEGIPDGREITFFPDDRLAGQSQFKNGLRDGVVKEWYLNGQLRLQGTNQTHRLMQATSFSTDGNTTGQVKDGNGTLVIHHLNGQRAEEHVFVEGQRVTTRRWDAGGKPIN
jgi:hypothetical protein